jgi:hypothetical protein
MERSWQWALIMTSLLGGYQCFGYCPPSTASTLRSTEAARCAQVHIKSACGWHLPSTNKSYGSAPFQARFWAKVGNSYLQVSKSQCGSFPSAIPLINLYIWKPKQSFHRQQPFFTSLSWQASLYICFQENIQCGRWWSYATLNSYGFCKNPSSQNWY